MAKVRDVLQRGELMLCRPILQIMAGKFLSDSGEGGGKIGIALLHPRAVAVYTVSSAGSGGGSGKASPSLPSYFVMTKAYEHPLERCAAAWRSGAAPPLPRAIAHG